MGIYVAKASAIRDLLMKHYPQARSPPPGPRRIKRISMQPIVHIAAARMTAIGLYRVGAPCSMPTRNACSGAT